MNELQSTNMSIYKAISNNQNEFDKKKKTVLLLFSFGFLFLLTRSIFFFFFVWVVEIRFFLYFVRVRKSLSKSIWVFTTIRIHTSNSYKKSTWFFYFLAVLLHPFPWFFVLYNPPRISIDSLFIFYNC